MNVICLKVEIDMKNEYIYSSDKLNSIININGIEIGGNKKVIIVGPCTFGSYDELYSIAKNLKKRNINFLRAGTFKSRTSPYSFRGLGDEGIEILIKVKKELSINIVTELMTIEQINKYGDKIDIIQIGSRNMYNYDLLKAVGKIDKPVLLKRGLSATYEEWLLAAEYILKEGNHKVILCERGIRNYDNETRNVLDIQAVPYIKRHTKLPILIDPSHASGKSYMIESMSKASLIAGADGLLIETHINPSESLCDSEQTINIDQLQKIIYFNERITQYEN